MILFPKPFTGEGGIYYDSIGDEIYILTLLRIEWKNGISFRIHRVEFADQILEGVVMDHGNNHYVGTL